MSNKNMTRVTVDQARKMRSESDWDRFDTVDVENADDEGFVPDWTRADLVVPEPKTPISLRLDADILAFFKSEGPGYQTRMNAVLRAYMEARKRGQA
ncbi:3-oxoacyl-ACP synthase [Rhodobacteraceae bacterium CCMM004]|nr:3-oxoacyl-ACP synthase [Rhodobacteraceae bacterium CCMM004]